MSEAKIMALKINEIKKEDIDTEELKKQIPIGYNLLKETPDDDKLRIIVASMLYFIDEKEKALKLLNDAPKTDNLDLKELKAIVYMDLNYYNNALKIFNEILDIDYNESILDLKIDCLSFHTTRFCLLLSQIYYHLSQTFYWQLGQI